MLAVITGSNTGMGLAITRSVAEAGYDVIMACYSVEVGMDERDRIVQDTGRRIDVMRLDLTDLKNVAEFAQKVLDRGEHIDLLMNNAGSLQDERRVTVDGLEHNVSVNYAGPYLLTRMLLPLMGEGTRIVNMASLVYKFGCLKFPEFFTSGCRGSYNRFVVYSNTKLSILLFTLKLSEMLKDKGITVCASDPWIVSTDIIHMNNKVVDYLCDKIFRPMIFTPLQGASPAIKLLLSPDMQGKTGRFYKKCWPLSFRSLFGCRSHGVPAIEGIRGIAETCLGSHYRRHKYMQKLWDDTEAKIAVIFDGELPFES